MSEPIRVRRYGDEGPIVLVLHGGPGAPGSAAGLAHALGARGFRALEPLQRRGHGGSSVAGHVADLAAVAPPAAAVVGWSWGAMLGLSFAVAHPARVTRLALVGCGTYDQTGRAIYRERMDAALGEEGLARSAELKARMAGAPASERDRLLGELGALAGEAQAFDRLPESPVAEPVPFDAADHRETWDDVLRLQADGAEPAAFASIRCPVLMLHGDADPHPGPETRDTLRAHLPQLDYLELARCGHEPWRERRGRAPFLEALVAWLMY